MTAARANHRLVGKGLIQLAKPSAVSLSNLYALRDKLRGQTDTLPKISHVRECITLSTPHEAFWARKSQAEIYGALQSEPLSDKQLAERTGRHIKTIQRNLKKMAHIVDGGAGEILAMVRQDGGKWRAGDDIDLDRIAKALGTFGGNDWQKKMHADERRAHRAKLREGAAQGKQDG